MTCSRVSLLVYGTINPFVFSRFLGEGMLRHVARVGHSLSANTLGRVMRDTGVSGRSSATRGARLAHQLSRRLLPLSPHTTTGTRTKDEDEDDKVLAKIRGSERVMRATRTMLTRLESVGLSPKEAPTP